MSHVIFPDGIITFEQQKELKIVICWKKEKRIVLWANQGCPTFWRLWATLEEELSWTTH